MPLVTRDDVVPRPANVLWVVCPKAQSRANYLIYSLKFEGIWTHYTPKGTRPCYHDRKRCFGGHDHESRRWYGYLNAFSYALNKPVFLQVPAGSAYALLVQYKAGVSLRGRHFTVTRGESKTMPLVFVENPHQMRPSDDLPPQRDCLPSVLHMWKCDREGEDPFEVIDWKRVDALNDIPEESAA